MYRVYRPSPLCRAYNLERALGTPAKIYYQFEGNNTSGSYKLHSALAQAYHAHAQGLTNITTETGAGQWGTALAEAAKRFAKLETILPAPESAHAIFVAMRGGERCREAGEAETILFGLTGTGYFGMVAYDAFNRGELEDHVPTDDEIEAGFATIPHVAGLQ
ncbi:pyridoxal-phosphate dependent enzyme [Thermophilibacter immobilis]|jgi:predicted alternative tryptophan synthase beta-subunit|uniref:pyridoxal-phosphate dependent enzyme n=1 Tax=Thermophilibacter immobilis TaxID=2779519 RepID=UPI001E358738|nr:pyridoxal-phosphate dependent enzyme [Thermophilibacter immobilis]